MLCTNCSANIKPVVAIDIDGTLGDFHTHFIRFMEAYLGHGRVPATYEMYHGERPMHEWAQAYYEIDYRTWRDIKLAYRQGAQKRSMPIFPGAAALVNLVREAGAEVWMTTTRPYMRLDNIDPDTRHWLERHGIAWDYMLYDDDKYDELYKRVGRRVIGVLDDLPEQLLAAHRIWGDGIPIQRATHWNTRPLVIQPWKRVSDLTVAASWLVKRVEAYTSEDTNRTMIGG